MSIAQLFLITNHTNLHVGAGSSNQGVIDSLIQRDHVDGLPGIHSSSLKGALREFFKEGPDKSTLSSKISDIFGSEADSNSQSKGNYIFHDGILLSYPVRSDKEPFFNAIAPMVFERLLENIELLNLPINFDFETKLKELASYNFEKYPTVFNYTTTHKFKIEEFVVEGVNTKNDSSDAFKMIESLCGERLVMFNNEDFKTITDDYNLPVIARNQLENGASKNLFYEQVVPRKTKFYFFASNYSSNNDLNSCIDNKRIQIGANGSIGYGLCNFLFLNNILKPKTT